MVKTVNLNAEIPPCREIHITLPGDVRVGPAEMLPSLRCRRVAHRAA